MAKEINEKRTIIWPWVWAGTLTVAALGVGYALDGNEHGSSKTNINTMPTYAVAPLVPQVTEAAPTLPKHAKETGMAVCANSVFIDWQGKQVIIRPVLRTPGSGRPLELTGVDAGGARFTDEQPRDNFGILTTSGAEDNDQRLGAEECGEEQVSPMRVAGGEYALVGDDCRLDPGDKVSGAIDAVRLGVVHHSVQFPSVGAMELFVTDLQGQS